MSKSKSTTATATVDQSAEQTVATQGTATMTEVKAEKPTPKSKMKYLNPATGKTVAYTRAKMLGLV